MEINISYQLNDINLMQNNKYYVLRKKSLNNFNSSNTSIDKLMHKLINIFLHNLRNKIL